VNKNFQLQQSNAGPVTLPDFTTSAMRRNKNLEIFARQTRVFVTEKIRRGFA